MNPKNLAVLALGLAITGFVGYMMINFLNERSGPTPAAVATAAVKQKVPPQIPTVKVLVAKSDLVVGTPVGRENLHWQLWPQESVAPSYVVERNVITDATKSGAQKLSIEDFIGGIVRQPISAGQPVTPGLISQKGERGFMAALLKPGMRAMSIPVSGITGVSGFILPGDRVDIMWDVKSSSKGHPFVQTLFEDMRIIAVDTKTQASGVTAAKAFTLELTPKQVELMSMAQTMGSLEFILRSVAPDLEEQKQREKAENGLLQVSMGEGIRPGALIGADILAVSKETEQKEITRDRYTLADELLYSIQPGKKPQAAPKTRQATGTGGGTGSKPKPTGGGSTVRIQIVRGSKGQTIKIK